ncbi:MAG TPA: antibiotic biosynthesis monooxygenase [Nitrososphaeraceae archaeon]|nr:antibiotic biosynthesis monooxygenase [Nitrososphaeraceae archaeon]
MEYDLIRFRAEFTIEVGKKAEFKKLVHEMSRTVEAHEPDTLSYLFYLNRDETKCIVEETYANSEAAFVHNNSIASKAIIPKIHSVSRLSKFEVYGNPNKELQEVLAGFNPQTYNLITGFSR